MPQYPEVQNMSVLYDTQVYHHLPTSWSGVCTLVLLFPELGVIQGNELLPIPVVSTQHRVVQVVPVLVAVGIATGIGTGIAGITTSLGD